MRVGLAVSYHTVNQDAEGNPEDEENTTTEPTMLSARNFPKVPPETQTQA